MYLGDFDPGAIIDKKFTTTRGDTGAPATLAGTPAIKVYKNNSTTESTSGVTLSVDFDSVTGLNNLRVDTSSDGTFYAAGSNFQAVITAGTVNSVSVVGYVVLEFSIQNRSQNSALDQVQATVDALPTPADIAEYLEANAVLPAKFASIPTEPASAPTWGVSDGDAFLSYLYALAVNQLQETATTQTLSNAAGDTVIGTAAVSDDDTTATRGRFS